MKYTSTRDNSVSISSAEAIVKGISPEGGLFVPVQFPKIDGKTIEDMIDMEYPQRAAFILNKYLDDFTYDELLSYAEAAYAKFEDGDAAPVVALDDNFFILELWHGPTHAFKDIALTLLPYLLTAAKKKIGNDKKTLILVATSGDTGKAALEGFKDVDGTDIMVFYPSEGVSEMQKLQMQTQTGNNVCVGAINGNFDDAQSAVKKIFTDKDINKELADIGYELSSANSINWGRLAPQIVYYISAYCDLVSGGLIENGDKVNFSVPTGNFGDILAGYYAYKMGLPVGKLIVASNSNNVLTDFFNSGVYDIDGREFFKTMSPSMDILISSNLERLLYHLTGDPEKVAAWMKELKENKKFEIDLKLLEKEDIFAADFVDDETSETCMQNFFEVYDYALDPHTSVGMQAYNDYAYSEEDYTPTVILSTASPYKFPSDVYRAVSKFVENDPFVAAKKLYDLSAEPIPEDILNLKTAERRFTNVYNADELANVVIDYVKGK